MESLKSAAMPGTTAAPAGDDGLVAAGAGRRYRVMGDVLTHKGSAADGAWCVFEIEKQPGAATPPHIHAWDEAYYVLSGMVEMVLGERTIAATPGMFIRIPPNTAHAFTGKAVPGSRLLTLLSPAGAEAFFADLDREARAGAPDLARLVALAARHGVYPAPGFEPPEAPRA